MADRQMCFRSDCATCTQRLAELEERATARVWREVNRVLDMVGPPERIGSIEGEDG